MYPFILRARQLLNLITHVIKSRDLSRVVSRVILLLEKSRLRKANKY